MSTEFTDDCCILQGEKYWNYCAFNCMIYLLILYVLPIFNIWSLQVKGGCPPRQRAVHEVRRFIMEEAVPTCSVAWGQHPPHSAQPIIWHLVLLDRDLCGNSMFRQRLLICVMSVVWRGKTLISLWPPFSTLQGCFGWALFWDVKTCSCFRCFWLLTDVGGGLKRVHICKMAKLSPKKNCHF